MVCSCYLIEGYIGLNFILSLVVYLRLKKYYDPFYISSEKNGSVEKINLHEKYSEFRRNDSLSFFRLFIGMNLFFWIKFILLVLNCVCCILFLKMISSCLKEKDPVKKRKITEKSIKFFLGLELFFLGIRRKVVRLECEEVYKKFLGEGSYKCTHDEAYSVIVSNHTGWVDIPNYLGQYACGFIAKSDVKNLPLVGVVAVMIDCLFVKREDAENRHLILEQIEQRQQDFLQGKTLAPLLIFSEGTVTSGKHILKFKKGAFHSCLPIKPITINTTTSDSFHLAVGASGLFSHFVRTLCYLYHNVEITELPVIKPTEYMYDNYSRLYPKFTEKWEIYSEVVREIMCLASGFLKSEKTFRDSCDYDNILRGKKKKEILVQSKSD